MKIKAVPGSNLLAPCKGCPVEKSKAINGWPTGFVYIYVVIKGLDILHISSNLQ